MTFAEDTAELSWRIPTEGEPQLFRIGLMQIAVATLFFSAIVLALAPAHMVWPAIAAIGLVGAFLLWRNWRLRGEGRRRPDNARIDLRGVAWFDESGGEHLFARHDIESFRVELDEETLHAVPALLLSLSGGYESQPIELHDPAGPENVRHLLITRLNLREQSPEELARRKMQASLGGIEAVVEAEEGRWELRGASGDLLAFCARLAEISGRLTAFPVGARPLALRLGNTVFQFVPASAGTAHIDGAAYCGSADELATLAQRLRSPLKQGEAAATIDVSVSDAPDAGQIRLVVASPAQVS